MVETLTPSVFVLRHLFLNSLPLISTRRRPTFPRFNLLRSSVSRNNVSSPIEWRFFVLFFRLLCLSLSLDALVCRWGARVANSSHERDRLRQYRAAIVYRFRDPMLRNDVSKFRVLMCIILGLVSNEDNRLVYQWRGIRIIRISCYLKVWSILKIFFNCIYLSKIYFFKMELLFCQFTLLRNIASI